MNDVAETTVGHGVLDGCLEGLAGGQRQAFSDLCTMICEPLKN